MRSSRFFKKLAAMLALLAVLATSQTFLQAEEDILFIGDGGSNTIKSFGAESGTFLGSSDGPGTSGLAGPRGLVVDGNELLVVNQNVDLNIAGEVLRFNANTGNFLGALISSTNRDAPFAPDGLVLGGEGDLICGEPAS